MASTNVAAKANLDGGDLGLGRGWKPGAIPMADSDEDVQRENLAKYDPKNNCNSREKLDDSKEFDESEIADSVSEQNGHDRVTGTDTERATLTLDRIAMIEKFQLGKQCEDGNTELNADIAEEGVSIGEIPIGTSLRQQKQFYDLKVQELFAHTYIDDLKEAQAKAKDQTEKTADESQKKIDVKLLQKNLAQAKLEVDLLKQDLELCQLQLQSKHKAISILRKQAVLSNSESQKSVRKASQTSNQYQQEINKLQFELEYKQTSLINSQQIWSERYERVSHENSALIATLEERSSEIRRIKDEKMAIVRERDELLALLDIQERERYEVLRPHSDDQPYGDFSSSELAILGACQCRKDKPEPCGCSYAAANLKREVTHMKEQMVQHKLHHQEAMSTIDAYRKAFDEQLNRNKSLVRQLAEMTSAIMSNNNKAAKFKAAMKWLLQQLNEDLPVTTNGDTEELLTEKMVEEKTQQELILMLVDMVSDKNEALAHQRLAARLMADRARELEDKLAAYTNAS